ncbi:MAG TPA: hypothetical protein PK035_11775 [Chitinophagales bacterium]|nr:hypothetical protein [Chitinophagales bacterium]HNA40088.1 hypothetical protein [Chitinophagales bacterium]HNC73046.1 hypothetical protein [Chitinophagales bacterium]HNG72535.1 hypothetical protein [Chitinophagales bacterium]HNI32187.1 hypothetical protein [Chitinophagales bacterium]
MFRFFKYIVLFILGYKALKMLFAQMQTPEKVEPAPPRQNIKNNQQQQQQHYNTAAKQKFNDAELIDYEEVK